MARKPDLPLVSVVTPSFHQGRFLREAIDSVLAQDYPKVEYLVVDGGSRDETLDVLRSYGDQLRWISEPDSGQSDAIDKGFAQSRGEILAWLNADDVYRPGAIRNAVDALMRRPEVGLVYGRGVILDEDSVEVGPFTGIEPLNLWRLLHVLDYILQPAAFFRRSAYESVGGLDHELCYCMDWDLWIKLAGASEVCFVDEVLAGSREWGDTKTATGGWKRIRELAGLIERHTGRAWSPGVRLYALDTLRRQLGAALPPFAKLVDSAVAFASRRIYDGVGVWPDGWLGPRAALVVPQRWQGFEIELEVHRLPEKGPLQVQLSVGGEQLGSWRGERPGRHRVRFELPTHAPAPLVEVRLASNFSFCAAPDRRRLSVRCVDLQPAGGSAPNGDP